MKAIRATDRTLGQSCISFQYGPVECAPMNPRDPIPSAVVKEDLVIGRGATAEAGQDVVMHYVGRLLDGTQFDSSLARRDPLDFSLGAGDLIRGLDEGIPGMRVGGKRRLTIPPELAYREHGLAGIIPPGATLMFEVELLEVC